jgi:hypothetical protein
MWLIAYGQRPVSRPGAAARSGMVAFDLKMLIALSARPLACGSSAAVVVFRMRLARHHLLNAVVRNSHPRSLCILLISKLQFFNLIAYS